MTTRRIETLEARGRRVGRAQVLAIVLVVLVALAAGLMSGCRSARGVVIYRDGEVAAHAYETAQWAWVPGEFGAGLADGPTSASMSVRHGVLGALGLAGIAAAAGAGGAVGGMLP